jgi:hypothetical protein
LPFKKTSPELFLLSLKELVMAKIAKNRDCGMLKAQTIRNRGGRASKEEARDDGSGKWI